MEKLAALAILLSLPQVALAQLTQSECHDHISEHVMAEILWARDKSIWALCSMPFGSYFFETEEGARGEIIDEDPRYFFGSTIVIKDQMVWLRLTPLTIETCEGDEYGPWTQLPGHRFVRLEGMQCRFKAQSR